MSRWGSVGPLLFAGTFCLATGVACGRPEIFRASVIAGGSAGTGGVPVSTGDDDAAEVAGAGGEDAAGDDAPATSGAGGAPASGGARGQDAGRDGPTAAGGADGHDAGRDVSADIGLLDGTPDTASDLPTEQAPSCASTSDCPCFSYGGHAYRFCRAPQPRSAAEANCASQGMRLVRVDNEAENQWVYATKVAQNFMTTWIGANDIVTEGDWRWPDNVQFWTGKAGAAGAGPVGNLYNAWEVSRSEPNQNGDEDCAAYWYTDAGWADLTCTDAYSYVCELY